jgi:pyruvate carboxylase
MAFTADLNPKGSKSMDLADLVKMEDYLSRRGATRPAVKPMAKTVTPVADAVLAKAIADDMLKSSTDDVGTPFRFNNSQR